MARKKKKRIASRGSVNTTILKTLVNGDKYGYEIIKEVEEYSDGKIVLKQPSLYSSLSRFEEKGIVSSYWGDSDIGGRRHYYHLTEEGHKYYNSNVLKIKDEDEEKEVVEEKIVEEKTIIPIEKDAIPSILNFDVKEENEVIPDHNFHKTTPIENKIEEVEVIKEEPDTKNDEYELILKLASKVKTSNKNASTSPIKKLHTAKPKKSQKVILDKDGIFKLRDEDYVAKKEVSKEKIIDNVIKRSNATIYGYPSYTEDKPTNHTELSEEEKKIKNQLFVEKFNNLTKSKLKVVEEKTPSTPISEPEKDIDYRSKLNSIIENNNKPTLVNNIYNYEEDDTNKVLFEKAPIIEEDEEDKFIDLEPTEFNVKSSDTHYVEEISNVTTNSSNVTLNRYEHKSRPVSDEKTYVLINKVKLIFGIILGLFLITELTVSYILFNNFELIKPEDNKLFIMLYIASVILSVAYVVPYFINKSQHALNNFKLKYMIILGILVFLVMIILIYCINALLGFDLENFSYFAVRLIVPAILSFNFVIMPLIYYSIIKNKNYYD